MHLVHSLPFVLGGWTEGPEVHGVHPYSHCRLPPPGIRPCPIRAACPADPSTNQCGSPTQTGCSNEDEGLLK